jgi:hypothetical protein
LRARIGRELETPERRLGQIGWNHMTRRPNDLLGGNGADRMKTSYDLAYPDGICRYAR